MLYIPDSNSLFDVAGSGTDFFTLLLVSFYYYLVGGDKHNCIRLLPCYSTACSQHHSKVGAVPKMVLCKRMIVSILGLFLFSTIIVLSCI